MCARVNIGIKPEHLCDQHLIAESVEITMITGNLRLYDFRIITPINETFSLGKGHINFFKNKLLYLYRRLEEVNMEMSRRNFNPGTYLDLDMFPKELVNDWTPTLDESLILRSRVYDRLLNPKRGQNPEEYIRYESKVLGNNVYNFAEKLLNSELYHV